MQPSLVLVRHAAPRVSRDQASTAWVLSEAGKKAAERLVQRLGELQPAAIVSSPEPKALWTAEIIARAIGFAVVSDEGFVEHKRPEIGFLTPNQFLMAIQNIIAAPDQRFYGGESANEAVARFKAALTKYPQRPLVVVTHGTVLALFVGRLCGIDAVQLWSSLKLPEAIILDRQDRLIARIS